MRVYISGAVTNEPDHVANFRKAQVELEEQGFDVINPVDIAGIMPELNYEDYMTLDLLLVDLCDAIYMIKGWAQSRGANRELGYALGKDKVIMYEH